MNLLATESIRAIPSQPSARGKGKNIRDAKILSHLSACLLFAAAVACTGRAYSQSRVDIRKVLDGTMLPGQEVAIFERSDTLYPSAVVRRGGSVRALPPSDKHLANIRFRIGSRQYDLFDYLALDRIAGLLILKDGKVVLEDYELGAGPETRWPSFSMAKSVTSTLIGAAVQDGSIASIDDPVTRYVPALRGSVYDTVSIRNLMQMASGVRWDETYTDPDSDCRKLADAQLAHKAGASLGYMKGLSRAAPAGSVWNYNSGETNIVGAVVEGATHMRLSAYLSKNSGPRSAWSRMPRGGLSRRAAWGLAEWA